MINNVNKARVLVNGELKEEVKKDEVFVPIDVPVKRKRKNKI